MNAPETTINTDNHSNHKDLREILNVNSNAFYLKVTCNSMENAGIADGDIVIAEKTETCENGSVVIADIDGQLLIRRYQIIQNRLYLIPETAGLSVIEFQGLAFCKVIGVVKAVIHKL